jgi:hypothetical protein
MLNFKNLNPLLKKYGKSIKTLRSDNRGNSLRNNLTHICLSMGFNIKRLFLICLNKMGLLKKNRTLVEMDRCMLYSKGLHNFFGLKPFVVLTLF